MDKCEILIIDINTLFRCGHPSPEAFDNYLQSILSDLLKKYSYSKCYISQKQADNINRFMKSNRNSERFYPLLGPIIRCRKCSKLCDDKEFSGRHERDYEEIPCCLRERSRSDEKILVVVCLVEEGTYSLDNICKMSREMGSVGVPCKILKGDRRIGVYGICVDCADLYCSGVTCCPGS